MSRQKKILLSLLIYISLFTSPRANIQPIGIHKNQQAFFQANDVKNKIYIDVGTQTLYLTTAQNNIISSYKISTGRNGTGETPGSYKTPRGIFEIHNKFGKDNDPMSKYKGRVYIGKYDPKHAKYDNILSRILTLNGKNNHNKNTLARCVYIHGTSATSKLGKTPCSLGCVRVCPYEITKLFNQVDKGSTVYIHDTGNPLPWEKGSYIHIRNDNKSLWKREEIECQTMLS